MTLAPDKSLWIGYLYQNALVTRIAKVTLNSTEAAPVNDVMTPIADLKDADADEATKPSQLVFVPSVHPDRYDLYISGLRSLYRINNCSGK